MVLYFLISSFQGTESESADIFLLSLTTEVVPTVVAFSPETKMPIPLPTNFILCVSMQKCPVPCQLRDPSTAVFSVFDTSRYRLGMMFQVMDHDSKKLLSSWAHIIH
jgi:hypothetical protein